MKKARVFTTGSLWSLLVYMLYSNEEEIKRTHYFFVDTGIHETVRKNFNCHVFPTVEWEKKPWPLRRLLQPLVRFYYQLRYPYLLNADIYGIDQGLFCQSVIAWHDYTLIEDGIGDYFVSREPSVRKYEKIKRVLFGNIEGHDFGNNNQCRKIVLSQEPTNDYLKCKGERIDIKKLWDSSSVAKQRLILDKLNVTETDMKELRSRDTILLTQPIAEDKFVSEEEKISIYRKLIDGIDEKSLIIKIHPRELTDYKKYFPNALVFDKRVPMQLFGILGLKYKKAITISSTSVTSFGDDVEIVFTGNEIHPEILKGYGHVVLKNISL